MVRFHWIYHRLKLHSNETCNNAQDMGWTQTDVHQIESISVLFWHVMRVYRDSVLTLWKDKPFKNKETEGPAYLYDLSRTEFV